MSAPELIAQMRYDARFQLLPLLNSTGEAVGLHFHRFTSGYLHVVQAWEDNYAASTCVLDAPNVDLPFAQVPATSLHIGTFAEVVNRFLQPGSRHRRDPASPLDDYKGKFSA